VTGRTGRSHGRVQAPLAAITAISLVAAVLGAIAYARPGARSPAASKDVVLGPTDPRASMDVTLVLRPRDPGALRAYLDTLAAGTEPARFLAPSAFGARFGPTDASIEGIRRALAAAGLTITTTYPQRTAIRARGPVGAVERLFAVRMLDHQTIGTAGNTERFHAPEATPTIPRSMRPGVSAVLGLSDRPTAIPFHHLGEVPAGGLTPTEVATAYGITPLYQAGVTGAGQTIAVVSYATFGDEELAAYDRHFDLSGPPVEHVPVAGGTTKTDLEANLDVEVIRAIAPQAQILNYEAPNGRASIGDAIDAIVTAGRAKVISISWGF
jgi:kumamolisin